jgi:hypothetical protein
MKRTKRTLRLRTETIQHLSAAKLETVVGGDGVTTSCGRLCRPTLILPCVNSIETSIDTVFPPKN